MNEVSFEEFEGGSKKLNQVSNTPLGHLLDHLTREGLTGRELNLNDSEVLVLFAFIVLDFEAFYILQVVLSLQGLWDFLQKT